MICPRCGHDNVPGNDTCEKCQLDLAPLDQPRPHDRVEQRLLDEPVRVLSPRPPVTVGGETLLRDAVKVMMDAGVGTVLVLDKDGKLAGIFSERDLLVRVGDAEAMSGKAAVGQFMTPNPETVAADDTLAVALQKMDVGGYRHLPVVRDGRPVGMISVRDMMRYITRLCQDG